MRHVKRHEFGQDGTGPNETPVDRDGLHAGFGDVPEKRATDNGPLADASRLWADLMPRFQAVFSQGEMNTWISRIRVVGADQQTVTLRGATNYAASRIRTDFLSRLQDRWSLADPLDRRLVVDLTTTAAPAPVQPPVEGDAPSALDGGDEARTGLDGQAVSATLPRRRRSPRSPARWMPNWSARRQRAMTSRHSTPLPSASRTKSQPHWPCMSPRPLWPRAWCIFMAPMAPARPICARPSASSWGGNARSCGCC
jgi:hypothetical protein